MARIHLIALRLLRRPDGVEPGLPALPIGATGAIVGRAPDCDLVLEDPLRLVSRQHAQLLPQGPDSAMLRCISASVSIGVNGEALAPGSEMLVKLGDRLRIGGFELQVEGLGEPVAEVLPHKPPIERPASASAPTPVVAPQPAPETKPVTPSVTPPPTAERAPAPAPFVDSGHTRLDRWFELDTVSDPLAPGSPLPAADTVAPQRAAGPAAMPVAMPAVAPIVAAPIAPAPGPSPQRPAPQAAAQGTADAAPSAPEPMPPSAAPTALDEAELIRAFLRGAGLVQGTALPGATLTPAWMQHLGALMRAATDGTLALLRSRAVTKRSIRAEGTQIAPRENNPLKFAPDAAEALALLVGRQSAPGFLDPVEAVRDAHNDLLVHQLAMVAGMRAAVFELISRFGPEAIEAQHGPAKGLARHLPALHQAALWQRHRAQHTHLIANLDDDFEAVFGREFLVAYEAQSKLAAAQRAGAVKGAG